MSDYESNDLKKDIEFLQCQIANQNLKYDDLMKSMHSDFMFLIKWNTVNFFISSVGLGLILGNIIGRIIFHH